LPVHLCPDILYMTIRELLKLLAEDDWYLAGLK
jgi:hypothetical protein